MTTLQVIHLLSDGIGLVAYLALLGFSIVTWRARSTGRALFAATLLSLLYLVSHATDTQPRLTASTELGMFVAWLLLLLRALGFGADSFASPRMRSLSLVFASALIAAAFALSRTWLTDDPAHIAAAAWYGCAKLVLCTAGLVVIEQLVRNTRADLRSRTRYLNIGLGVLFAFGFVQSMLIVGRGEVLPIWDAVTPVVVALPVPFVIIASLRNAEHPLRLNLSREFIFRSGVLVSVGIGLLLAAVLAYYAGLSDRDTGMAALVLLAVAVVAALFVVAGSSRTQAWAQKLIGRHLLADEHDYRAHWNRVTEQLTESDPDFTLEQQSIRALLSLFHSPGGALWRLRHDNLVQTARLHATWESPLPPEATRALLRRGENLEEIIDLNRSSDAGFEALAGNAGLRFLVPLVSYGALFGVIGIATPLTSLQLSAEDREIVRLTARQITGFLALREADAVLNESRQFDAMHRLTTFLIHDVKTTSSQLSLLLQNAERHKHNPAFVDDMLETVDHAASRLDNLLAEIRGNGKPREPGVLQLDGLLQDLVASFSGAEPAPILNHYNPGQTIYADRDRLFSALQHLLQNAVDATADDGQVLLSTRIAGPWLEISVTDTGTGMSEEFIDQELFVPFRSSKGVSGMGIGVYQARESVQAMGGDLLVTSLPGEGSTFTVRFPRIGEAEA